MPDLAAIKVAPYSAAFAHAYDAMMGDAAAPTVIAAVGRSILRNAVRTDAVADVGCGTGRVLKAFVRPGRRLFGIDRSRAMLNLARARLGRGATLLQQDMRALALPAPVDLVLCCFATINYMVEEEDLDRAFDAFGRNLREGGHLIFDFIPRRPDRGPPYEMRRSVETGEGPSVWRVRVDPGRGRTETRIAFHPRAGGPAMIERHVQRWWPPDALLAALRRNRLLPVDRVRLGAGGPSRWLQVTARAATGRGR